MDESHYPSLPRLNQLHARLAAQCRQVARIADRHLDPVEHLFRAATAEDWQAAASAVAELTALPEDGINAPLVRAARAAEQALRSDGPQAIQAQVGKLLSECRAARCDKRGP